VRLVDREEGKESLAEVKWYSSGNAQTSMVPLDALEHVLSRASEQRTAVMWGLEQPPEQFIHSALLSMTERGFAVESGLNIVRLSYELPDRWWKRGEPTADPSGATIATSAHTWDGCIVALSGDERFHLEFRLKGRGEAAILLHEREAAYSKQSSSVDSAMKLSRVLLNLYDAVGARYCCFPVAGPWLTDEDWSSLLRPPYYPDFFLRPAATALPDLPPEFRSVRLTKGGTMTTVLPIKFAPHDELAKTGERDYELEVLRKCKSLGEKYYDQMYEASHGATGLYSDAKDAFLDAISAANRLGLKEEASALEKRLEHVKAVFRSQFS
jgi:hypothetical protein